MCLLFTLNCPESLNTFTEKSCFICDQYVLCISEWCALKFHVTHNTVSVTCDRNLMNIIT